MFASVANSETLLAKHLKALFDELSLSMLRVLVNGPAACMDLAKRFHCSQSAAWKRLEELRKAGFVQRQSRQGYKGRALYIAVKDRVNALFEGIAQIMKLISQEPG